MSGSQPLAPTRVGLTDRQIAVYGFVRDRIEAGSAPTYSEIATHFGIARSNAHRVVGALLERGWLVHLPQRQQALGLPENPDRASKPSLRIVARDIAEPTRPVVVELSETLIASIVMRAMQDGRTTHQVIADAIAASVSPEHGVAA